MEQKKFIGIEKKYIMLLSWLTLVFGIVALAVDHDKMTKKEKQQIVASFVAWAIFCIVFSIFSIVFRLIGIGWLASILNTLMYVAIIAAAVFSCKNEEFECPCCFQMAGKFVHDKEEEQPEEVIEAELVEEVVEEQKEE